ncbi:protein EARLY FLOWERING 4-like [Salvia miltiorrhiza]|uniref:protein EARLY FLOWERING 4-like n=1 Tax=Salvia miltiorrhiza TaxID=226208 RepID=UPI0025AD5F6C|nr:protein EARLY FLOWERING 4-like [Salvia miltiorrhiza]
MDDASNTLISAANHSFSDFVYGEEAAAEDEEEEDDDFCDVETWETLSKSFRDVQSVLDRNRRLIQQVNDNHRSKMPHNLAKNVALICEINANMSKVVALYSSLSANLSAIVRQRRAAPKEIES